MRTKELKPNTEYATEDGTLVATGETVERGWHAWREARDGEVKIGRELPGGEEAAAGDPWSQGRRDRAPGALYSHAEGVRVTAYATDREGRRTGEGTVRVIDPKHIKGTWARYVELHLDKIQSRFVEADAAAAQRAAQKELAALAKAAGLELPRGRNHEERVGCTVIYKVRDRNGDVSESPYIRGGSVALGFRLATTLSLVGDQADFALASMVEAGH